MPLTCRLCFSIPSTISTSKNEAPTASSQIPKPKGLLPSFAPLTLALTVTLTSPLPALPVPSLLPPTTPYSQSRNLQLGLENGKIRPCPSTNPGCVSTNPKSSAFGFPWVIPENYSDSAVQKLRDAILITQRNVKVNVDEETPYGHFLQTEVDGVFGRDVMEFLVKRDIVAYRCMATKVFYVYPFTTALGDSKGQKERINRILKELGWYAPNFESMD